MKGEKSADYIMRQLLGARHDRKMGLVPRMSERDLMAYRLAKRQRQVSGLKLERGETAMEGSVFGEAVAYYSRMSYGGPKTSC